VIEPIVIEQETEMLGEVCCTVYTWVGSWIYSYMYTYSTYTYL